MQFIRVLSLWIAGYGSGDRFGDRKISSKWCPVYEQFYNYDPQLYTGLCTGVEKPALTCDHENYIFVVLQVEVFKNKGKKEAKTFLRQAGVVVILLTKSLCVASGLSNLVG